MMERREEDEQMLRTWISSILEHTQTYTELVQDCKHCNGLQMFTALPLILLDFC